jgi:hypothetical protein
MEEGRRSPLRKPKEANTMEVGTKVLVKNTGIVGTLVAVNGGWSKVQDENGEIHTARNGQVEAAVVEEVEENDPDVIVEFVDGMRIERARTEDDLPACLCGCGLQVLRKGRTFRQGHDQRYRGQIIRQMMASDDEAEALEAIRELQRHWVYSTEEMLDRWAEAKEKREAKQSN